MSRGYEHYSVDLPRSYDFSRAESPQSAIVAKRGSVAEEFGLGPLAEEEFKEYTVWNASVTNMRVCSVNLDGGASYYIENQFLTPKVPGVTVHSGIEKSGPVLGVAYLDYFSTSNSIGIGDPAMNPMGVEWYRLHKESFWTHVRYSFEVTLETGETKSFEWHRSRQGVYLVEDQGDLVLVEVGKSDVLAQYKGKGPLGQVKKQRGVLKIKEMGEEYGKNWETLVLLTWASLVELSRRRARQRRITGLFGRVV